MPDFNFAKGNSKRDTGDASRPRQPRAGSGESTAQQGSAPAHGDPASRKDLPPDTAHPTADAAGSRASVLDKYPERDLSHLSGDTPPPPSQADVPPDARDGSASSPDTIAEAEVTSSGNEGTEDQSASTGSPAKQSGSSSTWPLLALVGVVVFLILIAFIWHVNPWPSLKDSIADLFTSREPVENVIPETASDIADEAEQEMEATVRSWDYFIQVSSWPDLAKADLDAERFRAQGFDVIVESEFIPAKGGTYYRVRLGPYENSAEAQNLLAQHASALPNGAFVDSTRLAEDEIIEESSADGAELPESTSLRRSAGAPAADLVTEPMNGWAVKVSSFKNDDIAHDEARKLLEQGYPSFITKKRIGNTTWYRVLVGPFEEKTDANRYMQLLNVTYGNEAYTVDLASY